MKLQAMAAILAATAIIGGSGAALAFGNQTEKPAAVCEPGFVYSKAKSACVKASSGLLDDRELYDSGHALAKAGYYDQAIAALEAVSAQDDPMVLTMIGYSKRKQGHWDEGVAYYQRALAIDPENINTLEYLGEAYLTKGRVDLAVGQLARIEAISGTDSEQYLELAIAITEGGSW
jgi:tetratricopeptide (TPR) repeat protein